MREILRREQANYTLTENVFSDELEDEEESERREEIASDSSLELRLRRCLDDLLEGEENKAVGDDASRLQISLLLFVF